MQKVSPGFENSSWLHHDLTRWEHFAKPRLSQTAFLVKHFADQVNIIIMVNEQYDQQVISKHVVKY